MESPGSSCHVGSAHPSVPPSKFLVFQKRFPCGLLLMLTLCLAGCSGTPQQRTAPDYSALAPGDLLGLYLGTVTPAESLRFRFSSEVETEAGTTERLQGRNNFV